MLIKRDHKFFYKLFFIWGGLLLALVFFQEQTQLLSFMDFSEFIPQVSYIKKCGGNYLFSGFVVLYSAAFSIVCYYNIWRYGLIINKKFDKGYKNLNLTKSMVFIGALTLIVAIVFFLAAPLVSPCSTDMPPVMTLYFAIILESNLKMSLSIFLLNAVVTFGFSLTGLLFKYSISKNEDYECPNKIRS